MGVSDSCGVSTVLSGGTPLWADPPDHAAEEIAIPAIVRHPPPLELAERPRRRRTVLPRAVVPLTVRSDATR